MFILHASSENPGFLLIILGFTIDIKKVEREKQKISWMSIFSFLILNSIFFLNLKVFKRNVLLT